MQIDKRTDMTKRRFNNALLTRLIVTHSCNKILNYE